MWPIGPFVCILFYSREFSAFCSSTIFISLVHIQILNLEIFRNEIMFEAISLSNQTLEKPNWINIKAKCKEHVKIYDVDLKLIKLKLKVSDYNQIWICKHTFEVIGHISPDCSWSWWFLFKCKYKFKLCCFHSTWQ